MKTHSKIIVKGSIIMFAGFFIKTVVIFARNLLIGNALGAGILGTFTLANTIYQFISIFSLFGLYNTINKFAPQYRVKKDTKGMRSLVGTSFLFAIGVSLISIVLVLIGAGIFVPLLDDVYVDQVLRILIFSLPFLIGIRLISALTTSYETTTIQAIVEQILLPITTTVALLLLIALGFTHAAIPLGYLVGNALSFTTAYLLMKRSPARHIKIAESLKYFDKKYLIFAFPIFLHTLLFFVMSWFDTFALGIFRDSSIVGIYNVTLLIAMTSTLILSSVNVIFYPTLSALITEGKIKEAKNTFRNTVRIITFLTLPLTILFIVFAPEILQFFGEEFNISVLLMLILASGTFFNTFAGPVNLILYIYDRQGRVTLHSFIAAMINICINLLLIPWLGIIGAAIANATAQIVQNYLGVILLYRLKKYSAYSKKLFLTVGVGTMLGLVLWVVKLSVLEDIFATGSRLVDAVVILTVSTIFFVFFLAHVVLFRLYKKEDISILKLLFQKLRG